MSKPGVEFIRKVQMVELKNKLPLNTEVHYELNDEAGKTVFSKTIMNFLETNFTEKLEISHLPNGRYTLIVSVGNPPVHFDTKEISL